MNPQNLPNSDSTEQVYGFLCPKTNVFYAFESQETYQQFLDWLSTQDLPKDVDSCMAEERAELPVVTEADQLEDFDRATHEIMGVFNDPSFNTREM